MAALKAAVARHQSVVLRAPCGFGKSVVAAVVLAGAQAKGNKTVFGVHRRQLAQQISNTLDMAGVRHAVAMGGVSYDATADCIVGVTDTLSAHPELMAGTKLYIADEAHLHANGTRAAIIEAVKAGGGKSILVTATPLAAGGKTLGHLAESIVHGPSVASLIAQGNLARFQPYEAVRPDLKGLRTTGGDYATAGLEERFSKAEIIGDAVTAYRRFADGKRFVGYCYSRAHAAMMTDAFNRAGIATGYIDGETPDSERAKLSNQLADREIKVLMSVALLTEGVDLGALVGRPVSIEAVGLYRPTKSVSLAIQMMMRCMRPQDGTAIIIDHAGVLYEHGWPDEEREWSLEHAPKRRTDEEKAAAIATCLSCFAMFPAGQRACPVCGVERPLRPREIAARDGEMRAAERRATIEQREAATVLRQRETRAARTPEAIRALAQKRGYSQGWIAIRLRTMQK